MAERRMFAKSVIGSARFLRMPPTSRLLYYDLGMDADDDGCVEAFGVMRKTGANEDDLRVLASKGFIRILNEDLVTFIQDWGRNNQIRKDRYHEGMYKELISGACNVILNAPCQPSGNQVTPICLPSDNQMATEVSIGKSSIGKERLESAAKPPRTPAFSPPSVEEVRAYCTEKGYGIDPERFVDYYTSNGWMVGKSKMRNWKAAVRNWNKREEPKNEPRKIESQPTFRVGTYV